MASRSRRHHRRYSLSIPYEAATHTTMSEIADFHAHVMSDCIPSSMRWRANDALTMADTTETVRLKVANQLRLLLIVLMRMNVFP